MHGAFTDQLYIDGRLLGINTQKEVFGLFTHFYSDEGRTAYEMLSARIHRKQAVVPDFTTANHPGGFVL